MLATYEVVGLVLVLVVMLPVAVISLATGSKPPESASITKSYMALGIVSLRFPFHIEEERILKCYHIEPHLRLLSDLGLAAICAVIAAQLAIHFGLIAPDLGGAIKLWFGIPSSLLFSFYFFILSRALQRLRDAERA